MSPKKWLSQKEETNKQKYSKIKNTPDRCVFVIIITRNSLKMSAPTIRTHLSERCRLCESIANKIGRDSLDRRLYRCPQCDYVFVGMEFFLSPAEEERRYRLHKNSIEDEGYVKFLSTLLEPLVTFLPHGALVLDYGSGPEPVLAKLLEDRGFDVFHYDPFFSPALEEAVYNAITSSETFEHLYDPKGELRQILSFLDAKGVLGVMTLRADEDTDFSTWHYTKDPTHVGFYSNKTFRWIEAKYNLKKIYDDGERVIIWQKKS